MIKKYKDKRTLPSKLYICRNSEVNIDLITQSQNIEDIEPSLTGSN